jgi:hypothetical protein
MSQFQLHIFYSNDICRLKIEMLCVAGRATAAGERAARVAFGSAACRTGAGRVHIQPQAAAGVPSAGGAQKQLTHPTPTREIAATKLC